MSVSQVGQCKDVDAALRLLANTVGDRCFIFCLFASSDPKLSAISRSTWGELVRRGLIEKHGSTGDQISYRLTGSGWLAGLDRTGKLNDPALHRQLVRLRSQIKKHMNGRQSDTPVYPASIIIDAEVSPEWFVNVIESGLLDIHFPREVMGVGWWSGNNRIRLIRVPANFGRPKSVGRRRTSA